MARSRPPTSRAPTPPPDPPSSERRALRAPREPGPIEISRDVRSALMRMLVTEHAAARRAGGDPPAIDAAPILSLEAVDALEDHLRARMPDDALAVFAAHPAALQLFTLGRVGALTELAWDRGLSKARVVLGELGQRLACIPRRPDRGFPLRVTFFDLEEHTEGDSTTLAAWLERTLEESGEEEPPEDDGWEDVEREVASLRWEPRLERTLVRPSANDGKKRRVRHPRFGDGIVLRQLPESEKLEIDFGAAGVKVLVAKYVEELGDEG